MKEEKQQLSTKLHIVQAQLQASTSASSASTPLTSHQPPTTTYKSNGVVKDEVRDALVDLVVNENCSKSRTADIFQLCVKGAGVEAKDSFSEKVVDAALHERALANVFMCAGEMKTVKSISIGVDSTSTYEKNSYFATEIIYTLDDGEVKEMPMGLVQLIDGKDATALMPVTEDVFDSFVNAQYEYGLPYRTCKRLGDVDEIVSDNESAMTGRHGGYIEKVNQMKRVDVEIENEFFRQVRSVATRAAKMMREKWPKWWHDNSPQRYTIKIEAPSDRKFQPVRAVSCNTHLANVAEAKAQGMLKKLEEEHQIQRNEKTMNNESQHRYLLRWHYKLSKNSELYMGYMANDGKCLS